MSELPRPQTEDDPRPWYGRPLVWAAVAVVVVSGLVISDCGRQTPAPRARSGRSGVDRGQAAGLLANVLNRLENLEQYNDSGMQQVVDRLNQWVRSQESPAGWERSLMLDDLPENLQRTPGLDRLESLTLPPFDAAFLEETVWLRNIARAASGGRLDDLARAQKLFDWTVRNIQLEAEPATADEGEDMKLLHMPSRLVLMGRGTAIERAWIFMLLARQQSLDVVLLSPRGKATADAAPRIAALVSGKELYLFDPELGLAIPGPKGVGVATLRQVAADDGLLRRLDLDAEHPYPLKAAGLAKVTALIEGTPPYLSRRMHLIESKITGAKKVVLSVAADELGRRVKACRHVTDARLWNHPFEALQFEIVRGTNRELDLAVRAKVSTLINHGMLFRARLYHFKGDYTGVHEDIDDKSANRFYQSVRLSEVNVENPSVDEESFELARQDASYWLGLVAFERGNFKTAIDYFKTRTLEEYPDGAWTHGAKYNLARAYEAEGRVEEALPLYEQDDSPQRHGNVLRGRWLKESQAAKSKPAA